MSESEPMAIDVDHPLNQALWRDCILWAFSEEKIREAFENETGLKIIPLARGGISAMIDKAAGIAESNKAAMEEFMKWATVNIWGIEYAPRKAQEAARKYVKVERIVLPGSPKVRVG